MRIRGVKAGAAMGIAALSAGCALLSTPEPRDTYEISAPDIVNNGPRAGRGVQLLVPDPTAIKTLDSDRIVVKPTRFSVQTLENSQWGDRLPRIVQLRMAQAYGNSGRVRAGLPGQGLAIDYQVITEIRRFEIDATTTPRTAAVEIAVKLLNDRNGSVRATRVFAQGVPVSGTANSDYVAALDKAFDAVLRDIVAWTLRTV